MLRLQILIVIAYLLFFSKLNSQNYEQGYIVLNTKDTLYGKIKDRDDNDLYKKIKFINALGKKRKYSAYDILAYKKGIYEYESKWYNAKNELLNIYYYEREGYGEKVFLKVLESGRLSCYVKEFIDCDDAIDAFELFQKEGEHNYIRATQGIFGLKKKKLANYFWDCPLLVKKINERLLRYPIDVVKYYNEFCASE